MPEQTMTASHELAVAQAAVQAIQEWKDDTNGATKPAKLIKAQKLLEVFEFVMQSAVGL